MLTLMIIFRAREAQLIPLRLKSICSNFLKRAKILMGIRVIRALPVRKAIFV